MDGQNTSLASPYRIADYLTDEEKARALAAQYTPTRFGKMSPRTPCGHCALSAALGVQPIRLAGTTTWVAPSATELMAELERLGRHEAAGEEEMYDAVCDFVNAFDRGEIPDLAAALGVRP